MRCDMQGHIDKKQKIIRFITSLACIFVSVFIILIVDNIKELLVNDVIPFVQTHMSSESAETAIINSRFADILAQQEEVVNVVLYKFVPEGNDSETSNMFKGQIGVASVNRNGLEPIEDKIHSTIINKRIFQEILLNKVHYENITAIRSECEDIFEAGSEFTCNQNANVHIAYKTVVTIPISANDGYSVIGYIMLTLNREYDNNQITQVVTDISPIISDVQKSMWKF